MKHEQQYGPINILLADDDADDRLFFDKALNEILMDTHLTIVHNGEELMTYLLENYKNLPEVLFLDLSMPRKTGFECLAEIKEDSKLKELPVIVFTTSFGRSIEFEQSLINTLSGIGALEYIRKPGSIEQLKQIIQKVLITVLAKRTLSEQSEI